MLMRNPDMRKIREVSGPKQPETKPASQESQKFQVFRNGRAVKRAVFQEAQHFVVPSFPARRQSAPQSGIRRVGNTVKEKDLAEESATMDVR